MDMLLREYLPKEYREYAKLVRRIGFESETALLDQANMSNPHVAKYVKYFRSRAIQ